MKKNQKWYDLMHIHSVPRKLLLIMKISFMLLFAFLIQVSAIGLGQKVIIKQNKLTYDELFEAIELQTGIATLLSNRELNLNEEISVAIEEYELDELMDIATLGTGLTYEIHNDYMIVRPLRPEEKIHTAILETEKKVTIKGIVVDKEGNSLPGAAVMLKDTNIGTATGLDGKFTLQFEDSLNNREIQVTMLGFNNAFLRVDGREMYRIVLIEEVEGLDEVVVIWLSDFIERKGYWIIFENKQRKF